MHKLEKNIYQHAFYSMDPVSNPIEKRAIKHLFIVWESTMQDYVGEKPTMIFLSCEPHVLQF